MNVDELSLKVTNSGMDRLIGSLSFAVQAEVAVVFVGFQHNCSEGQF